MSDPKIEALAKHFDVNFSEIEVVTYDANTFKVDGQEYVVLTDEEADSEAARYIKDSLWAFNADFILDHSSIPNNKGTLAMIKSLQEKECEGANEAVEAMIEDMDEFIADAIAADGRGHFMNSYDGNEYEMGEFYVIPRDCKWPDAKEPKEEAQDDKDEGHVCEAVNLALFGPARNCCKTCGKDM